MHLCVCVSAQAAGGLGGPRAPVTHGGVPHPRVTQLASAWLGDGGK